MGDEMHLCRTALPAFLAALLAATAAQARPILSEFNYPFDSGGQTHGFISNDPDGEKPHLLLDNVRVGPPIDEKAVKVRTRERRAAGRASRALLDFEDPAQAGLVRSVEGDDVTLSVSDAWASSGKHSLKLVCKPGKPWTAFDFDPAILKGWQEYDYLVFDLYTQDPHFVTFTPEFWDAASHDYHTRSTYGGCPEMAVPTMHKGKVRVQLELGVARRNGKEGLSFAELAGPDRVDMSRLTKFKAWFSTENLKEDYVVYLDNVRLVQAGALDTNMKIDLPKGAVAFDFGEGSPLVGGFTEAGVIDVWADDKPYGFVDPEDLRAQGRDWPDPLTGDFVGPVIDPDSGLPKPAAFEFRVKAPNGKYLVWLSAEHFPAPNLHVDLNVNGTLAASTEMTGPVFYSEQGLFRFLNTDYSEKPGALWATFIKRMYPAVTLETEVAGGVFFVKGANMCIGALVLLPADRRAEFDRLVRDIEAERVRYFYKDLFVVRPENEPCRLKDEGLVLFAPAEGRSIMPWSGIDDKDAAQVKRVAAPGETLSFQVAVRPFRDVAAMKLSVSDLRGPGGAVIPAPGVEVYLKKYVCNGSQVAPLCLMPKDTVDLEQNLTRSFWLRVRVPEGAAAGVYQGAVTAAAGGVKKELPVEIQVYPIRMRDDIPLAIGYYYSPPDSGQWVFFDKMKDFQAERDRILREQMEILHDAGMTSVDLPCPTVTGLRGSGVTLDLAQTEKVAKAARAAGLFANPKQAAPVATLSIGRTIGRRMADGKALDNGDELRLPGFDTAFISGAMQLVEWGRRQGMPLVLWVVDEPREHPNPWNRNLEDTLCYLRLAGRVQGAVRTVTPMGDSNSGKDYLPLLDEVEIIDTHAGKSSARMIERAMTGKPRLWLYNVGKDRYSNGFYLWRVGSGGKHEWHFNLWVQPGAPGRYPGRDIHNPFLNYEFTQATVPAPPNFKGALLPTDGLFSMAAGAADFRYLHTLQQAIAQCKRDGAKGEQVAEAEKFLAALRNVIPVLPDVRNLAGEKDLALVGQGIQDGAQTSLETWKKKIAELIVGLQGDERK